MFDMSKMEGYKCPGVYCIQNVNKPLLYYGSSENMCKRVHEHYYSLRAGGHRNQALQSDFENGDDFICTVVQTFIENAPVDLAALEHKYIKEAKENGVNLYNVQVRSPHFMPKDQIAWKLADLYCREKFGVSFARFTMGAPAQAEMKLMIHLYPEDEEQIHKKYDASISLYNQRLYDLTHAKRPAAT